MKYFDELERSMRWLGEQPDTIFLGQAVEYAGTAMTNTLKNVERHKLLEMPVTEDMQMGITNGLALTGYVPISIYPRWNFLLLAFNQLVNHLDKIPMISGYRPKVIVRVGIGSERPLHPQYQHIGDYTKSLYMMSNTINVVRLDEPEQIFEAYMNAYESNYSTVLVEWGDFYNEK